MYMECLWHSMYISTLSGHILWPLSVYISTFIVDRRSTLNVLMYIELGANLAPNSMYTFIVDFVDNECVHWFHSVSSFAADRMKSNWYIHSCWVLRTQHEWMYQCYYSHCLSASHSDNENSNKSVQTGQTQYIFILECSALKNEDVL